MQSRRLLIPVASLAVVLAGCAEQRPDPYALAAAKCGSALHERLRLPADVRAVREQVEVTDLGDGSRKVTGLVRPGPDGALRPFECVVAPDASDKLRGLRVVRLTVEGPTTQP